MRTKNYVIAGLIIIIIALILFQCDVQTRLGCSRSEKQITLTTAQQPDTLPQVVQDLENRVSTLEQCYPCTKETVYKTGKKAPARIIGSRRPSPSAPVVEKRTVIPPANAGGSRVTSPGLATTKYRGEKSGDFGITIDDDSFQIFYISDQALRSGQFGITTDTPLLNSLNPGAPEFHYDASSGYWICRTNFRVTIAQLLSDETVGFAIFIGYQPELNYDMWIPHEAVKAGASLSASNGNISDNGLGGYRFNCTYNYVSL